MTVPTATDLWPGSLRRKAMQVRDDVDTLTVAPITSARMAGWTINAQVGTAYTLVLGDAFKILTLTNASAIALTIPGSAAVAFPIGTEIIVTGEGVGIVTVGVSGAAVVANPTGASLVLAQNQVVRLVKTGVDLWHVNKGSRPPDATMFVSAIGQLGAQTASIITQNAGINPGTCLGTSFPVNGGVTWAVQPAVALGTVRVVRCLIPSGKLVSNLHWFSSGTARTVGTAPSLWAGLWAITAGSKTLLAVSADLGAATWAAGAEKVFPMGTPYQTPVAPPNGTEYLISLCDYSSAGGVSPTLHGVTYAGAGVPGLLPNAAFFAATANTGVTAPLALGVTLGAQAASTNIPIVGWS